MDIPERLIDRYLGRKCGFFVGAGLSQGAGYPGWQSLLEGLIDRAAEQGLEDNIIEECRSLAKDPAKYLMLAETLKEDLGGAEFQTYLEDTFREPRPPSDTHELLVSLTRGRFILTTNYDLLIERAFAEQRKYQNAYKYYESDSIQRALFRRDFFVLKAHGDVDTAADKVVLTDKDYRRLLYKELGYQSVLQSIFTMYSVIFIGCSLQDPEIRLLLGYINTAFPEGGTEHYALLKESATSKTERKRWKKDYNVAVVPIFDFEELDAFLETLRQREQS